MRKMIFTLGQTANHEYCPITSVRMILAVLLLILFLLPVSVQAEDAGDNHGQVIIVENPGEITELLSEKESQPFIPEDMDKTVFGYDGRTTVVNPKVYPYCAIAFMDVHAKCGCTWTSTGFMVDRDRLLTAAHCLVCPKHSEWADEITFYFGYKSPNNCAFVYNDYWTAYVGNTFTDKVYTTDYDYGCVRLDNGNVGDTVGWFGMRWDVPVSTLTNTWVSLAGYRDGLKYDSGYITDLVNDHLIYTLDTQPGTSGGPIFDMDYYAIGINIAENNTNNIGFRINDGVLDCYYRLE